MSQLEFQLQQVSDKVKNYLEQHPDTTQAELALKIGVSEPIISILKNGKVLETNNKQNRVITDNVIKKVLAYFQTEDTTWETSNYVDAFNLFSDAKYNHAQGILDGPRGAGKSFTAESFIRINPSESFLVTCEKDMGIVDFTQELADQVGVSKQGSRFQVKRRVTNSFLKMNNPLLICDEMEEVKTDLIYSSVKGMYDYKHLYRKLGIVLIGANDYLKQLQAKAERKNAKSFPQMLSRFASNVTKLNLMTMTDAEFICKTYFGITDPGIIAWLFSESDRDYRRLDRKIASYLSDLKLKGNGSNRAA